MKKTFNLVALVTVSAYTNVEADTLEEAIKIAERRNPEFSLNDGHTPEELWIVEELDGSATEIREDV